MSNKKKPYVHLTLDKPVFKSGISWEDIGDEDPSGSLVDVETISRIRHELPSVPRSVRYEEQVNSLPEDGPYTLKVSNVSFNCDEVQLENFFQPLKLSRVNFAQQQKGSFGGTHRGWAFVDFVSRQDLLTALKEFNGRNLGGRAVRIEVSNFSSSSNSGQQHHPHDPAEVAMNRPQQQGETSKALFAPRKQASLEDNNWRRREPQQAQSSSDAQSAGKSVASLSSWGPSSSTNRWNKTMTNPSTMKFAGASGEKPTQESLQTSRSASIFGDAKPVDTSSKERRMEQKLEEEKNARSTAVTSTAPSKTTTVASTEPAASSPGNTSRGVVLAPPPQVNVWTSRKTTQQLSSSVDSTTAVEPKPSSPLPSEQVSTMQLKSHGSKDEVKQSVPKRANSDNRKASPAPQQHEQQGSESSVQTSRVFPSGFTQSGISYSTIVKTKESESTETSQSKVANPSASDEKPPKKVPKTTISVPAVNAWNKNPTQITHVSVNHEVDRKIPPVHQSDVTSHNNLTHNTTDKSSETNVTTSVPISTSRVRAVVSYTRGQLLSENGEPIGPAVQSLATSAPFKKANGSSRTRGITEDGDSVYVHSTRQVGRVHPRLNKFRDGKERDASSHAHDDYPRDHLPDGGWQETDFPPVSDLIVSSERPKLHQMKAKLMLATSTQSNHASPSPWHNFGSGVMEKSAGNKKVVTFEPQAISTQ